MDDDHSQAFIISVIQNLLSRNIQVIIFSHEQGMIDSIWDTYYQQLPLRLRISDFVQEGPLIESGETLQQAIQRAQTLAQGNEDNRRLAIKVIRRSVELLIRELCRQTGSTPPPFNANASNMLPNFQSCPPVTPEQCNGMRQTITFSNPGPHTQVGWAVPTQPQITPHIDRLRQYARQLNVTP
jgi:hypothetical protein